MQKQINLEEILKSYLTVEAMRVNNPDYTFNMVLSAMKDACKQTLELAAFNSKIEIKTIGEELVITDIHQEDNYTRIQVNLESILNTIKQVE